VVDADTDQETCYQIVGPDEADIKNGLLSISAPLARALIGRGEGDTVEVNTPGGGKSYEVLSVEFK
jgi:transcription elongation factor GreA